MYTALDLSKYIVSKCCEEDHPITNLYLQKILYYIQRYFLKNGDIAFPDEFEAWQIGPAIPNVYDYYCGFGAMPIVLMYNNSGINAEDEQAIDAIIESKRDLNPWDFVSDVHRKNGAWDRIYRDGIGNREAIPIELIQIAG